MVWLRGRVRRTREVNSLKEMPPLLSWSKEVMTEPIPASASHLCTTNLIFAFLAVVRFLGGNDPPLQPKSLGVVCNWGAPV